MTRVDAAPAERGAGGHSVWRPIGLATGMLMATQGCTAEQAEGLLRQAADHETRTIVQIAHRIIEQHNSSG